MKAPDLSKIDRTLKNESTPKEARKVFRWLRTSDGQLWLSHKIDDDLNQILPGEEERYISRPIPSDKMYKRVMKKVTRPRKRRFIVQAFVILLSILFTAGSLFIIYAYTDLFILLKYEKISVAKGEQLRLALQDESRIFLNSGTKILFSKNFGNQERKLKLSGEAWFEVQPNQNLPFILETGSLKMQIKDATFNIKAYKEDADIRITVETGEMEMFSNKFAAFTLKAGEKMEYNKKSAKRNISKSDNITPYSIWKENKLAFYDCPLAEILSTLSRVYNARFSIVDKDVLKYNCTLTTDKNDLNTVLQDLGMIAPVRFRKVGNEIKVMAE